MQEVSTRNFGILIAYLIPGLVVLWGLSHVSESVSIWLIGPAQTGPSVGGFFYVLMASVGFGMAASTIRWALIDTVHHVTGLRRPAWSDRDLHERGSAYVWIVENHYRYYQFYGNTIVAIIVSYLIWRTSLAGSPQGVGWLDASVTGLLAVFCAGSRNALRLYYDRTASLLGDTRTG